MSIDLSGREGDSSERGSETVTRRACLGSLVAIAGAGTAGVASATDEYELVELSPGERHLVEMGDGDSLENVLYDQTAEGSQVVINARGAGWTIRNVGVSGPNVGHGAQLAVADTGGATSTIENVYLGDGSIDVHRTGLGIWVAPDHSGVLEIERVNIQGMGDNSFYCSPPGGGGEVHIDSCYSKDSWVAHYRLARGSLTNSVAVNTGSGPDGRGLWAWAPGPVEVEDCAFAMNGRHFSFDVGANNNASQVRVVDTEYDTGREGGSTVNGNLDLRSGNGTDPEDEIPRGCPTSPEEAAEGDASRSWSPFVGRHD